MPKPKATPSSATPAEPTDLHDVEAFLRALIEPLELDPHPGKPGRPRILPALALWGGLLVCVLRGFSSQLALWRLLAEQRLWDYPRFPISDQAIYKRLAQAGTAPLTHLFLQLRDLLRERLAPYAEPALAPFAREVVVLDETTLDRVARHLPPLRNVPPKDARLLPGKLAGVFDLRRQLWQTLIHLPNPRQNEKVAARELLATVPAGSLILADLGYFGFRWFDELTTGGYWWVSRLRAKTSYTLIHPFYQKEDTLDALVWLGAYRADRSAQPVRLLQYRQGEHLRQYLTNVTDPQQLSLAAVVQLYARRWDIELAVKLVKRQLGLHLLWSAKDAVILQQVWAALIIAQLLHALRLEIAGRAGVDLFDVSLPLLVQYLPRYAAQGEDPVQVFVTRGRRLGFIRPSRRIQPTVPAIPPDALVPLPPERDRERTPRYAGRRCIPAMN